MMIKSTNIVCVRRQESCGFVYILAGEREFLSAQVRFEKNCLPLSTLHSFMQLSIMLLQSKGIEQRQLGYCIVWKVCGRVPCC